MPFVLGRPIVTPITPRMGAALRLADSVRECVVFLGFPGDYRGTAFLVEFEEESQKYRYLVTAGHVANHFQKVPFVVRANLHRGEAQDIPVDLADWTFHPHWKPRVEGRPFVDVAVMP